MYQSFYHLKGTPFEKSIKKEELFLSSSLKEFLSRMEYMKQYRGLMLVTGDSGVGKTTALRAFLEGLKLEFFKPIYIPLSTVSPSEFYSQLNIALGGENKRRKSDMFLSIQKLIYDYATLKKQIPVIIFDEIHLLRNDNLYELQILLNFNLDSLDPAIVILSAHTHFKEKLLRPPFNSINQRFRLKYHFSCLNKEEIKEYIIHHLRIVGGELSLFNENSIEAIYNVSGGAIRIINNLSTKALIFGATKREETITEEIIYKVSSEL